MRNLPGRVMASVERPSPIAARLPRGLDVVAYTKPEAFERWHAGIQAAGDIGVNTITIFDVIGYDYWSGGGFTLKRLDAALRTIGNEPVEVQINSPGGDMFEGIAIYNRLLEHPAAVTVKVLGLAASAASVIAMAGTERLIGPASFLMIHDCWVMAVGNRHDMAETAALLEPFDAAMAGVYALASGQSVKDVAGWMDAETWMAGQGAIDRGFATGLLAADAMKEDEAATAKAQASNAVRQAEIALVRNGASRTEARSLLNKIKGTPGAAPEDGTPGAADLSWLGAAAQLSQALRS